MQRNTTSPFTRSSVISVVTDDGWAQKPCHRFSGEIPVRTDAGTYYIWFKAAGDTEDYCSDPGCTVAEIKKAKLTVTARPKTIVYGDAPANDGADYAGFVGDDTETADGVLSGGLVFGKR